jgi:hypothetical protein
MFWRVMFWLSCSGRHVLAVMFWLSCSGCHVLAIMFWPSCSGCHVLAVSSLSVVFRLSVTDWRNVSKQNFLGVNLLDKDDWTDKFEKYHSISLADYLAKLAD